MTLNQGDDQGDPDDIVDVEDFAADYLDPFAPDAKASGKKGNKNKADKGQKEKKATKPIPTSFEGYTFTTVDKPTVGQPTPWIRTRRKQLPFPSSELEERARADQRETRLSSMAQFNRLGPNQQSIVNRLIDEKNEDEKEPNAMWSLFGVKKLYEEHNKAFRTLRVNNAIRVTIKRQDRAADKVSKGNSTSDDTLIDDDIFDLNKPRKSKKDAGSKDAKTTKKKKKNNAADENNFQGWPDVPQQNQQDHFAQPQGQYPQQAPYEQFHPQDQYPQQDYPQEQDPFNMQNMQGAIPVPQDVPPAVPMPPGHDNYQPPNAFQPYPDVYPQPDPHAFDTYDDRQPRIAPTSARHRSRSHGRDHEHDRSYSRPRRRDSSGSEQMRRMEEKIDKKLERNNEKMAEKLDNLTGMMSMAVAANKVSTWRSGGSAFTSSNTTSRDGGSSQRSYGRGYSTDATSRSSPEREPRGTLKGRQAYSRITKPHYRRSGRRDYPEENYIVEPAITYRHGRDRDYDRRGDGGWDDYPPSLPYERGTRAQPRVMNHYESVRPPRFERRHTEGTDFMRADDRRDRMYVNEEPRRRRRDDW